MLQQHGIVYDVCWCRLHFRSVRVAITQGRIQKARPGAESWVGKGVRGAEGVEEVEKVNCTLLFAAVLCNTAEDKLLSRLVETKEHNLLSIPAAHHLGQPLHVNIRLALKKIVKMVRF